MKSNINLNEYIDHTLLKPEATLSMIDTLCKEAKTYYFKAVCINPFYVNRAVTLLKNSNVKVCTVVGFPLGANTTQTKIAETINAIKDGAQEIDVVINIGALKDNDQKLVLQDLQAVRNACPQNIILKVIIECSLLTTEQKIIACQLVTKVKADFIKTSTGFANGGATVADIKLMKANIGPHVAIKASGGIKNQDDAMAMINAGATRIGTSNGVAIISGQETKGGY
ncbi:deoxyribose-phosphate aldolase [Spiroplasma endosymbiont of Lariophagus distinguendus]|uniref:deoxyribose-phosphate aldolase n=1 Tax=Spiroplasma endosymbiont of Lariophagus distinguendus TaxID=2935082 RepID=UPI0020793C50|nr:deoxyribose-phosphate aldolase [Spiroplasma endosymbiont of Lariophagus distinguendus]